ncbi:MAG: thioredoxin domain-containing protein [Acidobacteriota bacterium]
MKRLTIVFLVPFFMLFTYFFSTVSAPAMDKGKTASTEKKPEPSELKGLDLTGLSREQENKLKKIISENKMTSCVTKPIAELLKNGSQNPLAMHLAQDIINRIKEGKSDQEILLHVKRTLRANRAAPEIDPDMVYDISVKDAPFRGSRNAPVTIVEFSDFQCPYCANLSKILNQISEKYPNDVKHVFKNFPLERIHGLARMAAKAALAAGEQGKFWEMRQKLFDNFRTISKESITKFATELGLNREKFENDLNDAPYDALINADLQDGEMADVGGTPTIFINGKRYQGNRSVEAFEAIIKNIIEKPAP